MLAWLVAGYRDWRASGLDDPEQVTEATAAYRAESDALGRFLERAVPREVTARVGSTELFTAYEKWCAAEREDAGHADGIRQRDEGKGIRELPLERYPLARYRAG